MSTEAKAALKAAIEVCDRFLSKLDKQKAEAQFEEAPTSERPRPTPEAS